MTEKNQIDEILTGEKKTKTNEIKTIRKKQQ